MVAIVSTGRFIPFLDKLLSSDKQFATALHRWVSRAESGELGLLTRVFNNCPLEIKVTASLAKAEVAEKIKAIDDRKWNYFLDRAVEVITACGFSTERVSEVYKIPDKKKGETIDVSEALCRKQVPDEKNRKAIDFWISETMMDGVEALYNEGNNFQDSLIRLLKLEKILKDSAGDIKKLQGIKAQILHSYHSQVIISNLVEPLAKCGLQQEVINRFQNYVTARLTDQVKRSQSKFFWETFEKQRSYRFVLFQVSLHKHLGNSLLRVPRDQLDTVNSFVFKELSEPGVLSTELAKLLPEEKHTLHLERVHLWVRVLRYYCDIAIEKPKERLEGTPEEIPPKEGSEVFIYLQAVYFALVPVVLKYHAQLSAPMQKKMEDCTKLVQQSYVPMMKAAAPEKTPQEDKKDEKKAEAALPLDLALDSINKLCIVSDGLYFFSQLRGALAKCPKPNANDKWLQEYLGALSEDKDALQIPINLQMYHILLIAEKERRSNFSPKILEVWKKYVDAVATVVADAKKEKAKGRSLAAPGSSAMFNTAPAASSAPAAQKTSQSSSSAAQPPPKPSSTPAASTS